MLMIGSAARAQVKITCDKKELRSREEGTLKVVAEAGLQHEWRWRLLGPESPRPVLRPTSPTEARVTAPPTRAGGMIKVLLEAAGNPSIRAEFQIPVTPNPRLSCAPWQERDELVPGSFTPSLSHFQGDPAALPADQGPWPHASKLCFSGDAFAGGPKTMLRLNRCWIVAGSQGLLALTPAGEAVPWPGVPRPGPGRICRAVAVLPPGSTPGPGAPRLVYSESKPDPFAPELEGDGDTRIFALDLDGTRRELDLEEAGTLGGPRTVRDLALDKEGNAFVALSGGRGLWKVAPDGRVTLHAMVPARAAPGPQEPDTDGLLALALDPATGEVYVGDGFGVWLTTPSGAVTPVLAPGRGVSPCHLALHGRELLMADARRHELHAYHLDSRRLATILGSAGDRGQAPTRLGPIRSLNPDPSAEPCAQLGRTGPLASNHEGLCLLGTGAGLALLDLPGKPLTEVLDPKEGKGVAPPGPGPGQPPTRQASLERSRSLQTGLRQHKRELRLAKKLATRQPEAPAPAQAAVSSPRRPTRPKYNLKRLGLLTLVLCGTCWEPQGLGAAALPSFAKANTPPSTLGLLDTLASQATVSLQQLSLDCAPILLGGPAPAPCTPAYQTGLLADLDEIFRQMAELLVDPASLGAGQCRPGEPLERARARLTLDQGDLLASYDGLVADATAMQYRLYRDGFVVQAAGTGLLTLQAANLAAGAPGTGLGGAPGAVLGVVGNGVIGGGFGLQALGGIVGARVAYLATTARAEYQRYANAQTEQLLEACTSSAAPAGPRPGLPPLRPAPTEASPMAAIEAAIQKLAAGCALAEQHHLNLTVCRPETVVALRSHEGNLDGLAQGVACTSSGLLVGRQAPCHSTPLSDARTRSDTFTYFLQYTGEIGTVAWDVNSLGNGLHAAAQGLFSAANLAAWLGDPKVASGLVAGGYGLVTISTGLSAEGFELLRLGAAAQRRQVDVTHGFNAQSRAQLEEEASADAETPGSSTGAGAVTAATTAPGTGAAPAAGATGLAPEDPPTPKDPSADPALAKAEAVDARAGTVVASAGPEPARPLSNGAGRARPFLSWMLTLFTAPPDCWEDAP